MELPPLILASTSPRRAELMTLLPYRFRIAASDATEVAHEHLTPREVCQLNAHRKARAVAKKNPDALVLGADTLVFLGGEIFGKPRSRTQAEQMLWRLQGQVHQVREMQTTSWLSFNNNSSSRFRTLPVPHRGAKFFYASWWLCVRESDDVR